MAIPDTITPIPEPMSLAEQAKVKMPADKWTDEYAFNIVKSDWAWAESYRTNAHDWRYRNADELYLAWVGQRYWDGTRVPRSSLGVPVAYSQIEALLPKTVPAVTNPDGYNFYSENDLGKDEELIVLAWRELILKQLDDTRFRVQVARALKSMKQHGNGVLEVGFEDYEDEYVTFEKTTRPKKVVTIFHPTAGMIQQPSQMEEVFSRTVKREKKARPYVRYISLKDFYVDPNCESIILQEAGYVIKRVYMRAEQIKAFKDVKGFKIPDDDVLTQMSKTKSTANQDVSKLSAELFRYNMWNPAQDYTSDPAQKRLAVIEYTTNSRKVWWLQGGDTEQSIIYNQPNRYGQINYYSVPYADVLDRWHALSLCDVAEGEQRLQQAIINSRIDELALAIHPPTVKRRGVTIPAYQLKRRPGVVIEAENPESDIVQQEIANVTQNAFIEVQASELRVQKMVGLSDLAGQGVPTAGGNSANRTATGVNTQAGAQESRINYMVETIEDMLIEPVVLAVLRYDRKFLDMKSASNWLKLDPRFQSLDPAKVMNARIVAECRGSVKMRARLQFLQTFPQTMQFLLNPELLQFVSQQTQETLNVKEFVHMYMEALNYAPRNPLFIKMTPEQIKAQQQPPPAEVLKMQGQQAQLQSAEGINDKRLMAKLLETILKKGFENHAKFAQMDDEHIRGIADLILSAGAGEDSGGQPQDSRPS